jgi:hypothetical protein
LDVFPAGAGKIRINSIVPESYPWEGIYFDGIPVKLTAIANEGFVFSNWNDNSIISNTLNPVINDTLEFLTNSFTAFFTPDETGISNLVSNDLFISPNPANQFIHVALKNTPKFKSSFQIIDLEGKTIHEGIWESGVQKMNIDLGQVSKGIYVLRVTDGINHSFTKRFVKN